MFEDELDLAISQIENTLDRELAQRLRKPLCTVAVAESMTGGLLAERLTRIPGSSDYFLGGVVCYSPLLKVQLCQVAPATLRQFGTVSRETTLEMAKGIHKLTKCDLAVSITGVAGPGLENNEAKGTVFIGLHYANNTTVHKLDCEGTRLEIRERTTTAAMMLMKHCLTEQKND